MLLLNRKTFDSMILIANVSCIENISNAVLDILERYMMGQVFRLGDTQFYFYSNMHFKDI